MNPVTYEVKRAHWRATWTAIQDFRDRAVMIAQPRLKEMTPARFDILWAAWKVDAHIHEKRRQLRMPRLDHRISMSKLKELLGLAGPTVSRTAHRLEVLGYVRIVPDERDGRRVLVVLTRLGLKILRLAVDCITGGGGMRDRVERYVDEHAFDGLSREGSAAEVRQRLLVRLVAILDRWRAYAWHFGSEAVAIYDSRFWIG